MAWTVPSYPRQVVNAAGRALIGSDPLSDTWDWQAQQAYQDAVPIVNNWRSSHDYPLNTFQVTLRKYALDIGPHVIVAQRKKRLSSIELKLRRQESMKLTQMQDLGGCRAVVKNIAEVRKLQEFYKRSNIKHELASLDDYINEPKASGYRGIHLVYKYFSDKQKTVYNGLKIEIQIRSQYQHAWATAVETVGTFLRQALKSNIGELDWLRFFSLMGAGIAVREATQIVPNTPHTYDGLLAELREYSTKLNVRARLQGYGNALSRIGQSGPQNAHFYLMELDAKTSELKITGFLPSQYILAIQSHADAEKASASNVDKDVVLVSVDSLSVLERAYPNYFADTGMFLRLLEEILNPRTRKPKKTSIINRLI